MTTAVIGGSTATDGATKVNAVLTAYDYANQAHTLFEICKDGRDMGMTMGARRLRDERR